MPARSPADELTPLQRVERTLRGALPDRVPLNLNTTTHGARLLGLSLPEFFARPEHVAEGRLRFAARFGGDFLSNVYFAAQEAEAFGGETDFADDGPPTVGTLPFPDARSARGLAELDALEPPEVADCPRLGDVLVCTRLLAERSAGRWPLLGMAVGPASLPIILIGMERWLDLLLFGEARRRRRLLAVCAEFCVRWANAQLAAGATCIVLAEPMASGAMLTREQSLRLVLPTDRRVVAQVRGPVVFGSVGGVHSIVDLVPELGVVALSTDPTDSLPAIKAAVAGRIAVLGGLNDQAMLTWTPDEAAEATRQALTAGAPGGGFILTHQNEIPLAVGDDVLLAIGETAREWGRYAATGA